MALVAGLTLAALVLAAALTDRRRLSGAVLLGGLGVLWLLVNQRMEGAVLLRVTLDHGLTTADFAGVAAIGVALWRLRTIRRDHRR